MSELNTEQQSISVNATHLKAGIYFLLLQSSDGKVLETSSTIIR
jgi:hypothetical protein